MPVKATFTEDNKLKAKQYPIAKLFNGHLSRSGKALLGKCPFHSDSTPSFALYPETNSWYCFSGCGSGDVINLYMRLKNIDFKTAIKELS